jgi:O-antigen biosynthesis protein
MFVLALWYSLKRKLASAHVGLRPDPVFILGMHRSGTSALAGALEPLGLTVGNSVMPPNSEQGNPKGFYENLALMRFHDKFLASVQSTWEDPKPIDKKEFRDKTARPYREELLQLLITEFGKDRPLIKDPRMCRLMPLWIPLIREHFPQARFILPIRHPVEVARSLCQRDHFPLGRGLNLWTSHVLESERTTRSFCRRFTTYDQLLQSPVETVVGLAKYLNLPTDAIPGIVSAQLDSKLRHHTELSWPAGEPYGEIMLSIHRTLISAEPGNKRRLNRLRREYYRHMGWHYGWYFPGLTL